MLKGIAVGFCYVDIKAEIIFPVLQVYLYIFFCKPYLSQPHQVFSQGKIIRRKVPVRRAFQDRLHLSFRVLLPVQQVWFQADCR